MVATKVGVREFRAGLANFIESDSPTAVTKHGQTVGYFIPTRGDRTADRAALLAAGRKLDSLIAEEGIDVAAAINDFAALRAMSPALMATSRNLVLDANTVISAALGQRVRELLTTSDDEVSFFAPQIAFDDAERHLPTIAARRGWSAEALADAEETLDAVKGMVDSVPEEMYSMKKAEALARIAARDSDDWHFVALALILDCPVWTHDTDYLGSGIPTWATNTVEIYLRTE